MLAIRPRIGRLIAPLSVKKGAGMAEWLQFVVSFVARTADVQAEAVAIKDMV